MLSACMLNVRGRIQREGEVVHLLAHTLMDLSGEQVSVGSRDEDASSGHEPVHQPTKVRDIYIPDLTLDAIGVMTHEFR